ncbi:hypothetical protein [Mesorhizobium xinjiangense]|uniref:hypothetical protein n=1 Tax=Mesorhizobium xinjiangense TaxID=2678685 RepID=UPI001F1A5710|nr:hypothetical protein [Mesorhizobium xinjiangense]
MTSEDMSAAAVDQQRRLSDAIRDVKNMSADRDDVVVEMREASRMRLELLAQELEPVFADVPAEVTQFDFAISSGMQPRLWIDAVAHVAMGRDRRLYRFVRDTRNGRVVLAESGDLKQVADAVTRYIAERMVERERQLDGPVFPVMHDAPGEGIAEAAPKGGRWRAVLSGFAVILFGAAVGALVVAAIFWEHVAAYFSVPG